MKRRLDVFCEKLQEENVDAAFINAKENFFYLTGFLTDPHERLLGLLVFSDGKEVAVLPAMEKAQLEEAGFEGEIIAYQDHEDPWESLRKFASSVHTIGVEEEHLSHGRAKQLFMALGVSEVQDVTEMLDRQRAVKDEQEISIMREAAALADEGVEAGVAALSEGVTEMEVLATIEFEMKKRGVREMSFSTMVLFGEKAGHPHGNPGDRRLKKGDLVLFDLGVVWKGYTSDITRTVAFGEPDEQQREIYETVKRAEAASLELSRPGRRIGDLDQAARNIITEAGYGDYFPHRIGHGLGINVHEFPSMSHLNDDTLQPGMTFTIEPGIYNPAIGGVRIEDDVLITEDGYETLTKTTKELRIIE
ncbi:M24 family metallopeptidase [Salimicrobium flavidum]|uniref:Xaa-Pro dipeptidase n=1 Tax=Salimicrobium flavidum TaxID=570947 RepID=A0A1N7ITW7_9BACI|nr:Xaa-Pro peptidase family protein [Salimicrobium flavidum]SIS40545.1 Xaa-Pro dipeptidase [Salimicrobium flavidum]